MKVERLTETMREAMRYIAIVMLALAFIFFAIGMHKIKVYEAPKSEYSMATSKNAYVGGDAYNYIINGTYFAGYMALASGLLVGSTILGLASIVFVPAPKSTEETQESTPLIEEKKAGTVEAEHETLKEE